VALHAGGGRPSEALARFCGELRVGWWLCDEGDAHAKGGLERLQGYLETSFEPAGASRATSTSRMRSTTGSTSGPTSATTARCAAGRSTAFREELAAMALLPERSPDTDARLATPVPADPYLRFDTNDYSLDPRLVARRVELRISQREVRAVAVDTGELCASLERSFARHRTITALEHARAVRELRGERRAEPEVERRPLSRYDRLIPT
jgi:hypothetical protein